MARKTLTFALLALLAITAHAQHFDWVKHYHGLRDDEFRSGIVRMEADSEGNIYMMGRFTVDANIDGEYFLPTQYQQDNNNLSLFVAKMNPEGEMLWHKAIYKQEYPNEGRVYPISMRLVGDTALMMMANFQMPLSDNNGNRLYYLDTMIADNDGYPFPTDSSSSWFATGLITLDPDDGHLLEHHFLQRALIDTAGNVVRSRPGRPWSATALGAADFDVDSRGNIYLVRSAYDEDEVYCDTCANHWRPVSPLEGSIGAIRVLVDGVHTIDYTLPYATGRWNLQLMKFDPHFDTLLDATYVISEAPNMPDTIRYQESYMSVRSFNMHGDRLCICLGLCKDHDGAPIDRSDTLVIHTAQQHFHLAQDALLTYDTALMPQQLVQMDFLYARTEGIPEGDVSYGSILMLNTAYDADSNSLFVLGQTETRNYVIPRFNPHVSYRGDSLAMANTFFFLRLNPDNGALLSYGTAESDFGFKMVGTPTYDGYINITAKGNRVFAMTKYSNSIFFGDTAFYTASYGVNMGAVTAMGLAQWDYAGHQVSFYDFHAPNYRNKTGPVMLHDSSLYFSGVALEGASFGDIALPGSNTFIGRYVDKELLSPYVYDNRHADQYITWDVHSVNDTIYVGAINRTMGLSATSSSGLPVEYLLSNDTVARLINGPQLWIADSGTVRITAIQRGNTYWNEAPPVEKILRVGHVKGRIVWTQPLEFVYSDTIIHLNAFFILGDTNMTYSLPANNGVAELTGAGSHMLHLLGPGTVDITAEAWHYNPDSEDHNFHLTRTLVVHSKPVEPIGIDIVVPDAVKAYPNPTTGKVTILCPEPIATAWLTDIMGRREQVRLIPSGERKTESGERVYTLDLSGRPQATYLLTLATADGKQHTVKLLKRSDIFRK
ncbi:MAG: T9SS type A sorting domain-containing protein [Bacteroidales bacterium]|nr:T9SS type A sorting domain-containing protein [Bacteroidales bacterium]